jgi:hypothetical protein
MSMSVEAGGDEVGIEMSRCMAPGTSEIFYIKSGNG